MSAFVVDTDHINRLLGSLAYPSGRERRSYGYRMPDGRRSKDWQRDDWQKFGQQLHQLNMEAVHQRYPDDAPEEMPGPRPMPDPAATIYSPKMASSDSTRTNQCRAVKAWQCWHYQCAEGDVPETALYQWADRLISEMLSDIVDSLPEYTEAAWG